MFKKFIATAMAVLLPAALLAQTYPSPTYNNVTIQGNLNLPSETANKVMVSPDGSAGAPDFRALVSGDIPSLAASKITSGTFADARIPSLDAAKIVSGTFADARIPSLDAAKIATGVLPVLRGGTGTSTSTGTGSVVLSTAPTFQNQLNFNGAAGSLRDLNIYSDGSNRWTMRVNNATESGSNTGSNFGLIRRDDAGASLGTVIDITRSTGNIGINKGNASATLDINGTFAVNGMATAPTAAVGTNTTQIATTAFVLANNSPNFPSQTANTVFAAPDGSAGLPSFRSLVAADVPSLDAAKITTGTLPVARGGTGTTTSTGSGSTVLSTSPLFSTDITIDGAAGTNRNLRFTTATSLRWQNISNNNAESGSNAGSNYSIARYSDTGSFLSIPFWITRSTGNVGINNNNPTSQLSVTGDTGVNGNVNVTGLVGGNRRLSFQSSGSDRWYVRPSAEAESGSNAGSNFEIVRRDDAGVGLGTPFFIERATGEVGINTITPAALLDVNGNAIIGNGAAGTALTANGNAVVGASGASNTRISIYSDSATRAGIDAHDPSNTSTKRTLALAPYGGDVTAPTAGAGDNDTSVATTAFVSQNKGVADLRDYGGACNGSGVAALASAQSWSVAYGAPVQVSCAYTIGSNVTISSDIQFIGGGRFDVASGITVTFTGNVNVPNIMANDVFGGAGNFSFANSKAKTISACWFGACDGSADVADNLRRLFNSGMSNKNIIIPGGTYNLCSAIPVGTSPYVAVGSGSGQVGYPASNQSSVILKQLSNFKVDADTYGNAQFVTCAGIAQNIAFLFDRSIDFEWRGGEFVGSRSGLSTSTVNAPFQFMNNQRFRVHGAVASANYGDAGAFFEGDGNIDFVIEDNIGTVGQGIDMAFSRNGVYRNNVFTGASSDGNNIGLKGFSHIYDGPMVSPTNYIYSGVTVSENVKVEGNRFENYISGVVIQEGKHWQVHNNYLLNIKGLGSSPAAAVLANYVPSGSFSNVGHTPSNISIQGNQIDGLGTNVAGCGVSIGANAITNSDVFNRFIINGNMMSGTATSTGICSDTNSGAKVANVFIGINEYSNLGGLMNTNMNALDLPATLPR